ncbi:MAG: ATP-dependent Clp protease proteolytic subunit [Candidatus Saccharibacteria bacterium]|nr:ATP-dependent Clp protease proteolytic subunit [Candidatus Saccharibacteria bacterium]
MANEHSSMYDLLFRSKENVSHSCRQGVQINAGVGDFEYYYSLQDRRLYLHGGITALEEDDFSDLHVVSKTAAIVEEIIDFNRADRDISPEQRKPIRLYINSPGGDVHEGYSLISAIELSKTPIYTINVGLWCSMAFLIGIAGHKRFSLPNMLFLMHDGMNGAIDSGSKIQDKMKFDERFQDEVIKNHVLKHSRMSEARYDELRRVEHYMLPLDALNEGFIDEIVTDIDTIL